MGSGEVDSWWVKAKNRKETPSLNVCGWQSWNRNSREHQRDFLYLETAKRRLMGPPHSCNILAFLWLNIGVSKGPRSLNLRIYSISSQNPCQILANTFSPTKKKKINFWKIVFLVEILNLLDLNLVYMKKRDMGCLDYVA